MLKKALLGAILATSLLAPATGHAAQVIKKYKLTATFAPGAPAAVRNIVFGLNFDNSASFTGTTTGLTIFSSDFAAGTKIAYNSAGDLLTLSNGTSVQPNSCTHPDGTFCSFINGISGTANAFFLVEQSGGQSYFATSRTLTEITGAVPEPATWAFMILGFGLVGGAMRSSRRQTVRVAYA